MKFNLSAVFASTLAFATALACPQAGGAAPATIDPKDVNTFRLFALIKDGPYSQNSSVQAYKGSLGVNFKQNSTCADSDTNFITLFIDKDTGNLGVYSDLPPITAYVDRSGMGMGVLRFSTGVAPPLPKNAERGPWKITDDLTLVYAGANENIGLQACSEDDGKTFVLWLQGVTNPASYKYCTPISAQVWPIPDSETAKCSYNDFGINN